ncbi:MAG: helix-turn-helix domain-containing protein [Bacteroidales bacterium]|nr:helix-turn-helix domain-containing protein [Bacteroidales bacterium]
MKRELIQLFIFCIIYTASFASGAAQKYNSPAYETPNNKLVCLSNSLYQPYNEISTRNSALHDDRYVAPAIGNNIKSKTDKFNILKTKDQYPVQSQASLKSIELKGLLYYKLALTYENSGINNKALDYYHKSKDIFILLGMNAKAGDICNAIGIIYSKLEVPHYAQDYFLKADHYYFKARLYNKQAIVLRNLGNLAFERNIKDTAVSYFNKAIACFEKNENKYEALKTKILLAAELSHKLKYTDAYHYLEEALIDAQKNKFHDLIQQVNIIKARILIGKNNLKEAEKILSHIQTDNENITKQLKMLQDIIGLHENNIMQNKHTTGSEIIAQNQYQNSDYYTGNNVNAAILKLNGSNEHHGFNANNPDTNKNLLKVILFIGFLLIFSGVFFYHYMSKINKKNKLLLSQKKNMAKKRETTRNNVTNNEIPLIDVEAFADSKDNIWEDVLYWIEDKELYKDPELTSDILAQKCFSNKTYINEIIKSHTGKTYGEFINDKKVKFAKKLLVEYRNYSTLYIANKAGFRSKSSFYRLFKEKTGVAPGIYRSLSVRKRKKITRSTASV